MVPRRPDDVDAGLWKLIARHHRNQGTGSQMVLDKEIRKRRDPQPRYGGNCQGDAVIGLKPALWRTTIVLSPSMRRRLSVPCMST